MRPRSTRQRQALRLPPRKRQPSCRHTGISPSGRSARPSDISAKRNSRWHLALASLSVSRGALVPPNDTSGRETEIDVMPAQIVAVGVGHWRGEGMALIEAVS